MMYKQKLLDPRWQKRRLEILQRDGFACKLCADTTTTLHVHHNSYLGEPWESPEHELITVCDHCHIALHRTKDNYPEIVIVGVEKQARNSTILLSCRTKKGGIVLMLLDDGKVVLEFFIPGGMFNLIEEYIKKVRDQYNG